MGVKTGNKESRPIPRLGDYSSPFFRVRFFFSQARLGEFLEKENVRRLENNRQPVAFKYKKPTPILKSAKGLSIARKLIDIGEGIDQLINDTQLEKYITSLEISQKVAGVSMMTMVMNPPYDIAVGILDHRVIRRGSIAFVEWGYNSSAGLDILSGPHLFTILNPSAEFGDTISFTLVGNDSLSHNLMGVAVSKSWDRGEYSTNLKIVRKLVKELGFKINITEKTVPLNLVGIHPLRRERSKPLIQKKSNWSFFLKILFDNNCIHLLSGNTVYITDRGVAVRRSPRYNLIYRSKLLKSNDIPISTISFDTTQEFFNAPSAKNIKKVAYDKDAGVTNNKEVKAKNIVGNFTHSGNKGNDKVTDTSIGGVKANKGVEKGQSGTSHSGPDGDQDLAIRIQNYVEEASTLQAVKGTATIPGVPGIMPQEKIILKGVPNIFKGEYMIKKVVHKLGDGYTCELELLRQGSKKPDGDSKESDNPEQTKTQTRSTKPTKVDGK